MVASLTLLEYVLTLIDSNGLRDPEDLSEIIVAETLKQGDLAQADADLLSRQRHGRGVRRHGWRVIHG